MPAATNLTGQRFGRLVALRQTRLRERTAHECICDCGNTIVVRSHSLIEGNTSSCGCLVRDLISKRTRKHLDTKSVEHITWRRMKVRCQNPKDKSFANYGGRGIKVCDRWLNDYSAFLADMGRRPSPRHSLDRKDVNGDYEPSNCRWATMLEQNNNRRSNRLVEFNGVLVSIAEAVRRSGSSSTPFMVVNRLNNGWSLHDALTVPKIERPVRKAMEAA